MPEFARQPLLSKQQENELAKKMESLWLKNDPQLTGMQIAKALKFGIPGTEFEMLKPCYVYFFRHKFNDNPKYPEWKGHFPLRADVRFKKFSLTLPQHRCKRSAKELERELKLMDPKVFTAKLNEALPRNEFNKAERCFLIILY